MNLFEKGETVKVFDVQDWKSKRDVGDNSQYFKNAEILKIYWNDSLLGSCAWVADVQFEDGRISKGHFLHCIKKV